MSSAIMTLINKCLENEKAVHSYITAYNKSLETPGLKKLFVSITDQELEHEKQLQELLEISLMGEAFTDKIIAAIQINAFDEMISTETNLSPTQVLQLLMKYYEHTETVYKQLACAALDSEIRLVFQKLAESELKLKQWVQNRYDLETLSG